MEKCRDAPVDEGILFRSDAKAEDGEVAVGGWECRGGVHPSTARWFAVSLTQQNAPWLFCKGEPFRIIAALELLATLISVVVFMEDGVPGEGCGAVTGTAVTDNKGNAYVVQKMMTTSFPLSAFLMELSEQLERRGSWLDLRWVPRHQNVEADALTNGHFADFDPKLRVEVDLSKVSWVVLPAMLEAGGGMVKELEELREKKRVERAAARSRKKSKGKLAGGALKDRDPW